MALSFRISSPSMVKNELPASPVLAGQSAWQVGAGKSKASAASRARGGNRLAAAIEGVELLEDRRLLSAAVNPTAHRAPARPAGTVYTFAAQPKTNLSATADAAPTSHTKGVPVLNSRPGAAFTIYLDVAGFNFVGNWHADGGPITYEPGFTPAYDDVAPTGTFNANQQAAIKIIWAQVAESYSEFNVNVTTVDPAPANIQSDDNARRAFYDATPNMMHTVIGSGARAADVTPDNPGGNWFPGADGISPGIGCVTGVQTATDHEGDHTNFMMSQGHGDNGADVTQEEALYVGGIASHENAHSYGLYHQGDYTGTVGNYTRVAEYSTGDDGSAAGSYVPIIGDANNKQRIAWRDGIADVAGVNQEENDIKVMLATDTAAEATAEGRSGGVDLHLIDDGIGNSIAAATPLALTGSQVNPSLAKGLIVPTSESNPIASGAANYTTDYFSFYSNGSTPITLSVNDGSEYLAPGVADQAGTLNSTLNIYKANGTIAGTSTEDATTEIDTYTGTLPVGTYYAAIGSHGGHQQVNAGKNYAPSTYFDMGDFFLTGSGISTAPVNTAPVVTTNPASKSVAAGASVTFTAAASGTPTPTVQWQVSTDGGSTYVNVTGATSASLTFTAAQTQTGNMYRAVFTNSVNSATTTAATLTVTAATVAPVITTNPSNQSVTAGNTASFTAAATGTPTPTVQWQVSSDGGTTYGNVAGATSTTLSFTSVQAQTGYKYRAVFTNSVSSATTTAATLTVTAATVAPVITTNPSNQSVTAGNTASFTAAATGTPTPTVQWQVSSDGGTTYANVTGATSTTLSFTSVQAQTGYKYRAVFTNSVNSATTTAATLTVTAATVAPVITTNPSNQSVTAGNTASFTAAATGTPTPTVQWQVSSDGGTTYANVTGATSTTLSFTSVQAQTGYKYRAVFTNSVSSATTTAATLTVTASNVLPTLTERFDSPATSAFTPVGGPTTNGNNFGFSNTGNVGGTAGEGGGIFARRLAAAASANTNLGITVSRAQSLVLAGKFKVTANSSFDGNIFAGYFNSANLAGQTIAFVIAEPSTAGGPFRGRVMIRSADGTTFQSATSVNIPVGTQGNFNLTYAGNTLSGTIDGTAVSVSAASSTDVFNAFGYGAGFASSNSSTPKATAYFDDLTYNGVATTPTPTPTPTPTTRTQAFNGTSPFTPVGTPTTNGNSIGFSNTANAGGTAGEIGGTFARSASANAQADKNIGALSRSNNLVISGKAQVTANSNFDGNIFAGYFNTATPNGQTVAFVISEPATAGGPFRGRAMIRLANGTTYLSATTVNLPIGTAVTFSLNYTASTNTLAGTINGTSVSVTAAASTDTFDAYGIGSAFAASSSSTARATAFFDDLTYTVVGP